MSGKDEPPEGGPHERLAHTTVEGIRHRLDGIARSQRDLGRDVERLRAAMAKDVEVNAERTFIMRRVEERLNDLYTRFILVEQKYIAREDHERALAPFKRWGSWVAMLVIGAVITAVLALVLGKAPGH